MLTYVCVSRPSSEECEGTVEGDQDRAEHFTKLRQNF